MCVCERTREREREKERRGGVFLVKTIIFCIYVCRQGYCVPWGRVEYQAYQEERDQRMLFSHNSCRGEQDYADVRPQERQFDTICTTAQKPLCLGSQILHHKPATGVTGQCAPVYPSHHHTLWASWQVATSNTNGNRNNVMSAFQGNIFKYVTSSQKGKEMLERMDIGTTGVCKAIQQTIRALKFAVVQTQTWDWECRPRRKLFYNLNRWSFPGSDSILDPILWVDGYNSVNLWTDNCQECDPSSEHKVQFKHFLQHGLQHTDLILFGSHSKSVVAAINFTKVSSDFVYSSCPGCSTTYCSKRGLCEIALLAGLNGLIGPKCVLLPHGSQGGSDFSGIAQLETSFQRRGKPKETTINGETAAAANTHSTTSTTVPPGWVIKVDGKQLHLGTGTIVVQTYQQYKQARANFFPQLWNTSENSFVAQEYIQPFLGKGKFHRKFEIRTYVVVTSIDPLRVYIYGQSNVVIAFSVYSHNPNATSGPVWCMHDTHGTHTGSDECNTGGMDAVARTFTYARWSKLYGLSRKQSETLQRKSYDRIRNAILASHTSVSTEEINMNIKTAGARCFSFLRADIAVDRTLEPYVLEINSHPYVAHAYGVEPLATLTLRQLFQELFAMIGLVQVWRAPPSVALAARLTEFCVAQNCSAHEYGALQRMEYEATQRSQFVRVFPPSDVSLDDRKGMRALLPPTQRDFDRKVHLWLETRLE